MLCYGDSNTYGYDPRGAFGGRYPAESRWVDILAEKTGWLIQNEGQNGRGVPSRPSQYEMLMQYPVDLIAVMLGTNDLLQGRTATDTCARMRSTTFLFMHRITYFSMTSFRSIFFVKGPRFVAFSARIASSYSSV